MRKQLELWPKVQRASQIPKIWKTLTLQQKQDIINALAGLISKMVCSEKIDQSQETNHEG